MIIFSAFIHGPLSTMQGWSTFIVLNTALRLMPVNRWYWVNLTMAIVALVVLQVASVAGTFCLPGGDFALSGAITWVLIGISVSKWSECGSVAHV